MTRRVIVGKGRNKHACICRICRTFCWHRRRSYRIRSEYGGVMRVGEYFHNFEAAGAHEGGAKRDLGANARTRDSPNQDDFTSAYHVGQRTSGGDGWR